MKANIAAFGGDPGRVTIFGQSGGGAKCATLMAMPVAVGLFHRVLTMSGQQVWAAAKNTATTRAKNALAAMGINVSEGVEVTPEKLDALTMEQIQAGARTIANWLPVKDDVVLLRDPFDPDAPSMSNTVPMIQGNTKDEIAAAAAWQQEGLTWETLPDLCWASNFNRTRDRTPWKRLSRRIAGGIHSTSRWMSMWHRLRRSGRGRGR